MLFNRHLFIIMFSVFFIGVIFWWQKPAATVSAMAGGEYYANPYSLVNTYWKRLDYRQFNLAEDMIAGSASQEHNRLQKKLTDNPLLSIQKVEIHNTLEKNILAVKITIGSVIDKKEEINYLISAGQSDRGLIITSLVIQ